MLKKTISFFWGLFPALLCSLFIFQIANANFNILKTADDVKKFLSNSKWKIVESHSGLDFLDQAQLRQVYTFKQDNFYQYGADGSLLDKMPFQITEINQISSGYVTFKLLLEIEKNLQKKFGRKYDVYVYKVIDENNIKVCDGQEGNSCESFFIINRTN